jgi:hypothetical protein
MGQCLMLQYFCVLPGVRLAQIGTDAGESRAILRPSSTLMFAYCKAKSVGTTDQRYRYYTRHKPLLNNASCGSGECDRGLKHVQASLRLNQTNK